MRMTNFAWHEWGCTCLYPIQFGHCKECPFHGHDREALPEGCTPAWVESCLMAEEQALKQWHNSPARQRELKRWQDGIEACLRSPKFKVECR